MSDGGGWGGGGEHKAAGCCSAWSGVCLPDRCECVSANRWLWRCGSYCICGCDFVHCDMWCTLTALSCYINGVVTLLEHHLCPVCHTVYNWCTAIRCTLDAQSNQTYSQVLPWALNRLYVCDVVQHATAAWLYLHCSVKCLVTGLPLHNDVGMVCSLERQAWRCLAEGLGTI